MGEVEERVLAESSALEFRLKTLHHSQVRVDFADFLLILLVRLHFLLPTVFESCEGSLSSSSKSDLALALSVLSISLLRGAAVVGEVRGWHATVALVVGGGIARASGSAHVLIDESHHASVNR